MEQSGNSLLANRRLTIVTYIPTLQKHVFLKDQVSCRLDQLLIWLSLRPQNSTGKVLVQVWVHQTCISTSDLRLRANWSIESWHACPQLFYRLFICIELTHLLRRLHKLLFVLVSKLRELINVLCRANFQRNWYCHGCGICASQKFAIIEHDTVANGTSHHLLLLH